MTADTDKLHKKIEDLILGKTSAEHIAEKEKINHNETLFKKGQLEKELRTAKLKIGRLKGDLYEMDRLLSRSEGFIDRVHEAEQPDDRRRGERRHYPSTGGGMGVAKRSTGWVSHSGREEVEMDSQPWWEL